MPPVVVGVGANVVGAVGDDVIDVQLVAADVLADQDRRLDDLAQLAVPERRDAAVLVRVFEPEEAGLVAGQPDLQRLAPGVVLAGRVDHQVHLVADRLAGRQHGGDLALDRAIAPAVDLEGRVAHLAALDRELGERLGRGRGRRSRRRGRSRRRRAASCGSRPAAPRSARRTACRRCPRARCRSGRCPCGRPCGGRASGRCRSARAGAGSCRSGSAATLPTCA